jgi:hypothetical protein
MKDKQSMLASLAKMMLVTSGANIVAPKEVKEECLKRNGLSGDDGYEYEAVAKILNNVSAEKRVKILQAAIATTITPSQMLAVRDEIHEGLKTILEYVREHPECKKEVDGESAISRLLET